MSSAQTTRPLNLPPTAIAPPKKFNKQSFLQHLLFVFNIIFLLSGAVIICAGVYAYTSTYRYIPILGGHLDFFLLSVYLMIITGILIISIVFVVGCCAALKKNRKCIFLYSFLLLIIFLMETTSGVMAYIYELMLEQTLTSRLFSSILHHFPSTPSISHSLDNLQSLNGCCGSKGPSDWLRSEWHASQSANHVNASVPEACCKVGFEGCNLQFESQDVYAQGCLPIFQDIIREQLIIVGGLGLGLCFLQLFGIIVACCLAKSIRKRRVECWQ